MRKCVLCVSVVLLFLCVGNGFGADFYIEANGKDTADRDGKSKETAFASLQYAVSKLPEGANTILIGSGTFEIKKTVPLKRNLKIVGSGTKGESATVLIAHDKWPLKPGFNKRNPPNEYLMSFEKAKGLEITNLSLRSKPTHRITGGLYCMRAEEVTVHNVHVEDFRWGGLHFEKSKKIKVYNSTLHNCSVEKSSWWGGNIRSRYLEASEIYNNVITSDTGGGYGYKASGHTGVKVHHNYIKMKNGFSIESAHEHEYGLEIYGNYLLGCISVPKPNQSADPKKRGFDYTVWIHDNYLEDSYTIEGPRNYMRVNNNYINITMKNGRCYTHHGGINNGPIWIHNNIIKNVDRSVVWMNRGLAENIHFYNNTVFAAVAGDRKGAFFGAYEAKRLNNWTITNNIFVAPAEEPRSLMATGRGVPSKIIAKNNICVNVTNVPEGNFTDVKPEFAMSGDLPWSYYMPASESSNLVDKGIKLDFPFKGEIKGGKVDIGALEFGATLPKWDVAKKPE